MRKELEEILIKDYPTLLNDCGSLSCEDGWFLLIKNLCEELKLYPYLVAVQIKEKFGGLRFYIGSVSATDYNKVYSIIGKYEKLSYATCEKCGNPGEITKGLWLKTLCADCKIKM